MNKKGMEMWWILAGAALAIFAVIILALVFKSSGEKGFGFIDKNIEGLNDCDKDRVADIYDKCKYDPAISDEFPAGTTACGPQKECVT